MTLNESSNNLINNSNNNIFPSNSSINNSFLKMNGSNNCLNKSQNQTIKLGSNIGDNHTSITFDWINYPFIYILFFLINFI